MKIGFSQPALDLFGRLPSGPFDAAALEGSTSAAGTRHLLRRLRDGDLIDILRERPLNAQVSGHPYAQTLHGFLARNPKNADLLAGAGLPLLAVLSQQFEPVGIESLCEETGLHANTVRATLRKFRNRGLIARPGRGLYELAEHALTEDILGGYFARHELSQRMPTGMHRVIPIDALQAIVESDEQLDLPLTAVSRFQVEGAQVVARRFQYHVHAFRQGQITLRQAYQDAARLKVPPRTLKAMELMLND